MTNGICTTQELQGPDAPRGIPCTVDLAGSAHRPAITVEGVFAIDPITSATGEPRCRPVSVVVGEKTAESSLGVLTW